MENGEFPQRGQLAPLKRWMERGALPAFGPGECVPAKETASAKGGETIRL